MSTQLRLYAKYYRSMDCMTLPDFFEARVTSYEEKERFINDDGVELFFTFVVVLPSLTCIIFLCYVVAIRKHLENVLKKSDHYSSQAALVCVSLTYTLYVVIMDTVAVIVEGIEERMTTFLIFLVILEYMLLFLHTIVLIILSCYFWKYGSEQHNLNADEGKLSHDKVKSWFVILGLIPPLVCLSAHIGIIIEGWASLPNHGKAVMLFYSLSFIYLFVSFKKVYLMLKAFKDLCLNQDNNQQQKNSYEKINSTDQKKPNTGLDFIVIVIEMLTGTPILVGILMYIAYGFTVFPVLQSTDDAITYVYNLGRIAFVFAIFLLTYIAVYRTSGSIVSENVLKFWKHFYEDSNTNSLQNLIESDADEANALSAALVFHLLEWKKNEDDNGRYETLLNNIVGSKKKVNGGKD